MALNGPKIALNGPETGKASKLVPLPPRDTDEIHMEQLAAERRTPTILGLF